MRLRKKQYPFYPACYYDTFKDFLDGISAYGDRPAVRTYDNKGVATDRTFRELCLDAACLRKALARAGLSRKRAVIAGENSYEWLVAFFAVTSGGGVAICVDIDQDEDSVSEHIRLADGEYLFTTSENEEIAGRLFPDSDSVILLDRVAHPSRKTVSKLISEGSLLRGEDFSPAPEDVCAVLFTSGTTSKPKAVCLSHSNMMHNVAGAMAVSELGDNVFSGLPMFHAYGLNCGVMHTLVRGARLTICSGIRNMMRDAFACEAVTFIGVPLMLEEMIRRAGAEAEKKGLQKEFQALEQNDAARNPFYRLLNKKKLNKIREACFGKLQMIVTGGAYMNDSVTGMISLLGIRVLPGYGITECSPLVAVNRPDFYDSHTVGTVLPGYEIRFEDEEILLRGPCVMKEYYKDPEATKAAIDPDGWFHTGDLGCFTSEGHLKITGRKKKLIVFKNGNKVSPEKFEEALRRCPLVKEVQVYAAHFGQSKDDVGIAATIYPDPTEIKGLEQYEIFNRLQAFVDELNAGLPTYQQIQIFNIREDPFDRTASGKIRENAE